MPVLLQSGQCALAFLKAILMAGLVTPFKTFCQSQILLIDQQVVTLQLLQVQLGILEQVESLIIQSVGDLAGKAASLVKTFSLDQFSAGCAPVTTAIDQLNQLSTLLPTNLSYKQQRRKQKLEDLNNQIDSLQRLRNTLAEWNTAIDQITL